MDAFIIPLKPGMIGFVGTLINTFIGLAHVDPSNELGPSRFPIDRILLRHGLLSFAQILPC